MLRHRAEGPERLRGRSRHHLRWNLQGRLSGQLLEARGEGHLHQDLYAAWSRLAGADPASVGREANMKGASAGTGLKPEHAQDIFASARAVDFFEIHAENYMGAGGPPHHLLRRIACDYPLSVHGVGPSIGGVRRP